MSFSLTDRDNLKAELQARLDQLKEVNRMAEADIAKGNPITGAHHRAIEKCRIDLERQLVELEK